MASVHLPNQRLLPLQVLCTDSSGHSDHTQDPGAPRGGWAGLQAAQRPPTLPVTSPEMSPTRSRQRGHVLSTCAKAQKGPRGQCPVWRMSLHLVDL